MPWTIGLERSGVKAAAGVEGVRVERNRLVLRRGLMKIQDEKRRKAKTDGPTLKRNPLL